MAKQDMPSSIVYISGSSILSDPKLSPWSKAALLFAKFKDKLKLRCHPVRLRVGAAKVEIDLYTPSDWYAFKEVVLQNEYDFEVSNKTVLDIGAHRGYFLAQAADRGAANIISFEPEPQNYQSLKKVADSLKHRATNAHAHHKAVAAKDGNQTLYVSEESWSHSLEKRDDRTCVKEEKIESVSLDTLTEEAKRLYPNAEIVAKLDVEGSEGEILLSATNIAFKEIELLALEYHYFCKTPLDDIISHLESFNLVEKNRINGPGSKHTLLTFGRGDL